ncbi:MAG: hypothetical protein RLZZ214_4284 [Verrucomicrobiota bacterium]
MRKLTLCALLGAAMSAHAAPVLFPNGDFETAGGASWGKSPAPPTGNFLFPATGGNPGGYGEMGNTQPGGYAVLISNNDQPYPLSSLGLVAGNTYTFSYDMIASVAGAAKGGVKIESWSATAGISNSGDQRVTAASTGWATYTYNYQIDPEATHIKIVPLWTPNETVGFDNIGVNNTPFALFAPLQIPNGDFEIPAGANWSYYTDGFGLTYPTTGGNPGGNAVIDGTSGGGYGVLVAFSNAEKRAASLGLTPGGPCTIQMDMKIVSGTNVGGLKLEGPAGFAPVIEPAPLAGVGVWATYTFEFTLQNGLNPVSQFKIVPLGRSGSIVAYDNIKIVLPGPPAPLQATITQGTSVSWAASAANQYQPQEGPSVSGPWTNLGSPIVGNTVTSRFDSSTSPFYQVLQSVPSVQEAAYNGNFTLEGFDADEADGWNPAQSQWPLRLATGGRTDNGACMQLQVLNVGATPNGSEIQQNTNSILDNENGAIVPGNSYTLSFWAKQISSGASYVQEYRVSFLAEGGAEVQIGTWQGFSAPVGGDWQQKTLSGLVAPAGAVTALIQIVGKTGAVDGGLGEVLIDDVSLLSSGFGSPTPLAAATVPAVEISWPSLSGWDYQVQSSGDLSTWSNFGGVIVGDGSIKAVYDTMANPSKFYKVGEF